MKTIIRNGHPLRYRLPLFSLIPLCLLLSSCFQLIEEITVNTDGSGTLALTANLSQSRSKLASVMLLDSVNGYKVPSKTDIRKEMAEVANTLRSIKGISKVSHTVDFDKYIINIRFSFNNVANLNDITALIFDKLDIKASDNSSYSYHAESKTFKRSYAANPQAKSEYGKLKQEDKAIFENATYTSIYRFDRPVFKQTNSRAKVAASKKAVMLQCRVLDLIEGKIELSNDIQLAQ
ncbi:hypothetical protein [Parapedobacter sp.]